MERMIPVAPWRILPMGKYLLIALLILPLVTGCAKAKKKKLFLPSNETVEQFGDGRFEIRRTESRQTLYDSKLARPLFQDVRAYLEEDDWIYTVNIKNKYCLLNTESGDCSIFCSLNDVPEEHKATFLKLSSK
jgi:hypothetical protein